MGETKDCSQGFDFSEVLKDAVGNLPPVNLDNESRFSVAVTRIVGSSSSADWIVLPHAAVTAYRGKHDHNKLSGGLR